MLTFWDLKKQIGKTTTLQAFIATILVYTYVEAAKACQTLGFGLALMGIFGSCK